MELGVMWIDLADINLSNNSTIAALHSPIDLLSNTNGSKAINNPGHLTGNSLKV